ncbi:MAG: hypothetical protein Q8O67_03625 [Deltaproteobacteria bacterium]|nr:hypothetical protein [Deltaproteobacteria bacterium]
MRLLRAPTALPTEQTDDETELPAWIIDGLPPETPRLEAPRLQLPLPMSPYEEQRRDEPLPSTIIIIDL